MADVTNELMYEVLKQMQQELAALKEGVREIKDSQLAIRTHVVGPQQDVSNIYSILTRHDQRPDRIERRLELVEAP
jgi:hypothetical protein